MAYRIKPDILRQKPQHVTLINGVAVSLTDKEVRNMGSLLAGVPPVEVIAKPATQEQLKYLYEVEHHPFIEQFGDKGIDAKAPAAQ